jgi:hypothetical protein
VSWEPRPIEKGDLARSLFYMDTRYEGDATDGNTSNLTLVGTAQLGSITSTNNNMGNLDTLLRWNYEDGVANVERRRNHLIYTSSTDANGWSGGTAYNQGNRNPFIDHPEWVWAVFGAARTTRSFPSARRVPTAHRPPPSTSASSRMRLLGFDQRHAQQDRRASDDLRRLDQRRRHERQRRRRADARLQPAHPRDPGQLERRDRRGWHRHRHGHDRQHRHHHRRHGPGSDDGNDTINVTGSVLDHAQPSFVSGSSASAQTLDFSYVPANFAARSASFNVYNNPAAAGAALTAALDVDGVSKTGSASMNTTVIPSDPASPLAPGVGSRIYAANFAPGATEGLVTATHTIATSDENIPGATARPNLVLTTTGRVTAGNFPVTGSLFLFGGETFNTTTFNIADGATVTKLGPGTMNVNGSQSHGATAALVASAGPVNFLSDSNSAAAAAAGLSVSTTASPLTFQSPQHLRRLELLGTGNATVTPGGNHTLVLGALDFSSATARLNVNDNNLIVRNADPGVANGSGVYDGIQGLVQRGYDFTAWDGSGIVTTTSDATAGLTTLAVARAGDALFIGATDTTTWRGETVGGSDVLAMYTYAGDVTFDGLVDASDYGIIDNYYQFPGTSGYVNGDFNYDGTIDAGDYGLIDNSFQLQGAPIGSGSSISAGALGAVSAVPEPTAFGFAVLSAFRFSPVAVADRAQASFIRAPRYHSRSDSRCPGASSTSSRCSCCSRHSAPPPPAATTTAPSPSPRRDRAAPRSTSSSSRSPRCSPIAPPT